MAENTNGLDIFFTECVAHLIVKWTQLRTVLTSRRNGLLNTCSALLKSKPCFVKFLMRFDSSHLMQVIVATKTEIVTQFQ